MKDCDKVEEKLINRKIKYRPEEVELPEKKIQLNKFKSIQIVG